MSAALEDILDLARAGQNTRPQRTSDIGKIVADIVADAQDRGEDVGADIKGPAITLCWPDSVRRMIQNLIGNAVKYAGSARVSVGNDDDQIVIRVDDDGPGLSPTALSKILRPFHRGETPAENAKSGAGLGLAIAQAVASAHQGQLSISNRSPRGLNVTVRLPKIL